MVKILSLKDQQMISATTKQAEAKTNAHIATVILPASDTYSHYIMLCGFIAASLVDLYLWHEKIITQFPTLLCIQLLFAMLFPLIPGMINLTLKFLPKHVYQHRAAQVAAEKRLAVSKNVNSSKPVLLIFISLAERYIHIFPNAVIRDQVPDTNWDAIVRKLIHSIPKTGVANACVNAIEDSSELLLNAFNGKKNQTSCEN